MTLVEKRLQQFVQGVRDYVVLGMKEGDFETTGAFCDEHCDLLGSCDFIPETVTYDPDFKALSIEEIRELFESGKVFFSAITKLSDEDLDYVDCDGHDECFGDHVRLYIGIGTAVQSEFTTFAIIEK